MYKNPSEYLMDSQNAQTQLGNLKRNREEATMQLKELQSYIQNVNEISETNYQKYFKLLKESLRNIVDVDQFNKKKGLLSRGTIAKLKSKITAHINELLHRKQVEVYNLNQSISNVEDKIEVYEKCNKMVSSHRERVIAEREQPNSRLLIGSQVFKELNDNGEFYEDYRSDSENAEIITPEHRRAYFDYIKNAMTTVLGTPEELRVEMPIEIKNPLIKKPVNMEIFERGKAVHDKDTLDTISGSEMDDYIYYIHNRLDNMQKSMLVLRNKINDDVSQSCIPCTKDREINGQWECQQHNKTWRDLRVGDAERNRNCPGISISE